AVMIPAGFVDLDEPHSRFDEAAGENALAGVFGGRFFVRSIHLQNILRFIREIEKARRFGLHAEGEFEGLDESFHFRSRRGACLKIAVERLNQFQLGALLRDILIIIAKVTNGGLFRGYAVMTNGSSLANGG